MVQRLHKVKEGARIATPPRTLNQRAQAQDLSGAQGKAGDTRKPYKIDRGKNDTGAEGALSIYAHQYAISSWTP